jgi:hypothetical protein
LRVGEGWYQRQRRKSTQHTTRESPHRPLPPMDCPLDCQDGAGAYTLRDSQSITQIGD